MAKPNKLITEYLLWIVAHLAIYGLLLYFITDIEVALFVLAIITGIFILELIISATICKIKGEKGLMSVIKRIVNFRNKLLDYVG